MPTFAGKQSLFERFGRLRYVFVAAFSYSLALGFAIQLVILPIFLPQLDAGHGLMVGHDSIGFNAMASQMAYQIQAHGWSAWKLRPDFQGVVGIAAAIYAITGIHEPWAALPVYAAMYALSAICIYRISSLISSSVPASWAAVAGFIVFPSAAMIYADLHKDVWSCAGLLLILAAWAEVESSRHLTLVKCLCFACVVGFGVLSIWVVRPYLIKVLLGALFVAFIVRLIIEIFGERSFRRNGLRILFYGATLVVLASISFTSHAPLMNGRPTVVAEAPQRSPSPAIHGASSETKKKNPRAARPLWSSFVSSIISVREGVVTTPGGSLVDKDVQFHSLKDLLLYAPRALEIGLLAPFPNMWFSAGMTPGSRLMRLESGLEMAVCYVLLIGLFLLVPRLKGQRRRTFLLVAVTCLSIIGLMGFAMPNVGTLYRMRFSLFMLIVGLGAAGWELWLESFKLKRTGSASVAGPANAAHQSRSQSN